MGFGSAQGTTAGFGPAQGGSGQFGFGAAQGAPAAGPSWTPATALDAVAAYDFGDTTSLIKGGYDLVPADDDYFARTTGAIPLVSGGVPQYPISVVSWFKTDTIAGGTFGVITSTSDGTTSNRLVLYRSEGNIDVFAEDGTGATDTALAGVTAGRWHCVVAVWAAANSRAIYLDTATAGTTSAVSRSPTGLAQLHVGRTPGGTLEWDGVIAYTAILPVDLSGAGNATKRSNIFAGADPETEAGVTATALYKFDNDNGADAKGSFGLTASGTPVAQNNIIVVRDPVGTYHQRATTSAPTYDATLFSTRGGVAFTAASSQFLVCESTPITAAPFQIYAVAQSASATADQGLVWIGDKDVANQSWALNFAGAQAGDPIRFTATATGAANADTSSGYTADTTRLLWALETSSTSRAVRIDGGSEGTNTTSTAPTGADRIGFGGLLDSTPSAYAVAKLGAAWVLNSTDVTERALAHSWVNTEFGTSIP